MTKLSDAIQSARRHGGRSIGFGTTGNTEQPKRGLLIASIGSDAAGADVHIATESASIAPAAGANADIPLGLAAEALTRADVDASQQAGAAFVIIDPTTTNADALLNDELEYGFRIALDADEGQLRAIGSLRPAIVIVVTLTEPLPVTDMLALRRAVMLTGAPAGVRIDASASAAHLQSLRDSGAAVVGLLDPSPADVDALRARIAELPEPARKRRSDAAPTVPGAVPAAANDDDDFDE